MLRYDLVQIFNLIDANSRVLDLGCGDGSLLNELTKKKQCIGYGIEIDTNRVILAIEKDVNVIQGDLEKGLSSFADNSFDYIVLSQTIQAMQNVEEILIEMKRVSKQIIVTFPNFGFWKNRLQIGFKGHMPISENMPYQWYNTPNIHWCTLKDFSKLCFKNNLKIIDKIIFTKGIQVKLLPNLLGSLAIFNLGRIE